MKVALLGMCLTSIATIATAQTAPGTAPSPAPCASAAYRGFDFWVGRWEVRPFAGGPLVAHSLIESLYGGCAVRENWMPLKGGGGGSLNSYDSRDGKWHQSWVDAGGTRANFTGALQGDAMVLTGEWAGSGPKGEDGITRMTYSKQPGGGVRQKGEFSADGGKSWVGTFDLLYTPAKPA